MDAHELEAPGGLNLAERIRRLANGRNTIDVARFQFIGLHEVRGRYGVRWNEKRDRVQQVARHFISQRISPDDVLIPAADGFLLVFGSQAGVLADAKAHRISAELNAFFVGQPDLNDLQFEARHKSMSVDDFAQAFGDLIAESHELATQAFDVAPGEIPIAYTPVWDARRGALTTFFVTPLDAATGYPLDWDPLRRSHTDMDELKLKSSEDAIKKLFASGKRVLVGVALHISSLNNQQSMSRLLTAAAKFDKRLAKYRIIRISGVEPGFPRIYLEDVLRTLRTRMPNVAIGFNWSEPDIASVLKLQPAVIGFSLPPGALGRHSQADVYARIHAAAELARHHNIPVGVEGDIAAEHALRFAQDGVQHMASPRLWPVRSGLTAAELWHASRLTPLAKTENAA
jgi:hypothetical protein